MLSGWPVRKLSSPDDRVAFGQEPIAQVRAEEAGRAGNEDPHQTFLPMAVVAEAQRQRGGPARTGCAPSTSTGRLQAPADALEVGVPVHRATPS